MSLQKNRILHYISGLIFLALFSCQEKRVEGYKLNLFFGAEKVTTDGKSFYFENDSSYLIKNAHFRTSKKSRTGEYSYRTSKANPYGISIQIPSVKADDFVTVSVWRDIADSKSFLVVSGTTPGMLYKSTMDPVFSEDGWEKLELEFFIPPTYTDKNLKVYVWNNSKDTVCFDDLTIDIIENKTYPVYEGKSIHLEVDTSDYLKLLDIRKSAFHTGILQSNDDHWIQGIFFGDEKMMKTKLRYKGDWLDHLHGEKWSFRIKLKKGNTWKRMRTFSLHTPISRNGVDEWYLHKVFQDQGVLATRYGFVPVAFGQKNLGIYAWEEHFTKQLIESQNKREGPIIRFFEDVNWDQVRAKKAGIDSINLPIIEAAVIKPFATSKIIEDSNAYRQFLIAQNLLMQYKNRTKLASDIFNIDALSKYYALCDVFKAYHSIVWHNQRFYYNPVLCKLEPIVFDAYTETGFFEWITRTFIGDINFHSVDLQGDQYLMARELFNDFEFLETYIEYLEIYSSLEFLNDQYEKLHTGSSIYDSLIQLEFKDLKFDISRLQENAKNIRVELPDFKERVQQRKLDNHKWRNASITKKSFTNGLDESYAKNLVVAYKMESTLDSTLVRIINYFPDPVLILGVGNGSKKITEFIHPELTIQAYNYNEEQMLEFWVHKNANYLFLMAGNERETIATEIMPWPEPTGELSPLQTLLSESQFPDYDFIEKVENNRIIVKSGMVQIDHKMIIPKGYEVIIRPGTTIDIINKGCIISYSPVYIQGLPDNHVIIKSSDFSANGFTVLQAHKKSEINYAEFENLNTLDFNGWTLTGAVNFYESDVSISNSLFFRNQCEDALNTIRSDFSVVECKFDYIYGDAFDSDFCTGLVSKTIFNNIGNDAIDFSGSQIHISDVIIESAKDKGISGGEYSSLVVDRTKIYQANIGIASKDLSVVKVSSCEISNCNYGLVLLQKKPEYGAARIIINDSKLINPKTRMLIEKGSIVVMDGDTLTGKDERLAEIFYN